MQSTLSILNSDGTGAGSLDLQDGWIELEKGTQAVHDSVVAFMARQRAGTACTKTRAAVAGGGAKPYRQKGTGRARAGSTRSPVWVGGGTAFGPVPRSYAKKVNRKVERLALKRAFSERVNAGDVIVVADLDLAEPRTRLMAGLLKSVGAGDDALVIVDELRPEVLLAARNLPRAEVMKASMVNSYWMLLFRKVVFTRAGFDAFVATRLTDGRKAQ
jgi:large subunit ribosomal protein L4